MQVDWAQALGFLAASDRLHGPECARTRDLIASLSTDVAALIDHSAFQSSQLTFLLYLNDDYEAQLEGSFAYLLSRNLAIGAEYRTKPDNLGIATEDDAWDVFVAWAPIKNVSLTVAYVDLGNIVIRDEQRGVYASLQVGF